MNEQNTNIKKKIPNTKHLLAQGPWEVHLLASAKISLPTLRPDGGIHLLWFHK